MQAFVERSVQNFFILPLLLLTPTIWISLDCRHQSQKCSQGEMIPLYLQYNKIIFDFHLVVVSLMTLAEN